MSAARARGQEANDGEGTGQGRTTGADRLRAQGRAGRRKSAAQTPPLRRHQDNAALQRDPAVDTPRALRVCPTQYLVVCLKVKLNLASCALICRSRQPSPPYLAVFTKSTSPATGAVRGGGAGDPSPHACKPPEETRRWLRAPAVNRVKPSSKRQEGVLD